MMQHETQIMQSKLGRVRGLGSAKDGTHHWWMQRVTALALIILSVWFVGSMLAFIGADRSTVMGWVALPWNAIMIALFTVTAIYHGSLGLQVVIEDYVHGHGKKILLLVLIRFIMVLASAMTLFAVLKIAFTHA